MVAITVNVLSYPGLIFTRLD